MTHTDYGYGLWGLALVNAAVFILFAFSFFKPATKRDWRSFGAFSAFIIALFAEMYGFPLTIFVLSGWLQSHFPGIDWWSHDAGHLLEMMFGWRVNPHFGPFHIASFVLIGAGFWLISAGWAPLHAAQRAHKAGDHRNLCQGTPPAICRVHPRHAWLPAAMADSADARHVPGARGDVFQAGVDRRKDCACGIW